MEHMCDLFNLCLQTASESDNWKNPVIDSIYKWKGARMNVKITKEQLY